LLSFEDLYDHSGDGMAAVVLEALHNSQITDKIGCITVDNATNNDTLCFALSEPLNPRYVSDANLIGKTEFWDATQCRIRCFPHVIIWPARLLFLNSSWPLPV
jgi:hypothetical protein